MLVLNNPDLSALTLNPFSLNVCIFNQKVMRQILSRLFGPVFTQKICRFHQREVQLFRSILGLAAKK